jgi:hypothetical protein
VPVPGVPTAWDGQGARPGDGGVEPRQRSTPKVARSNTEIIVGPITNAPKQAASRSFDDPQSETSSAERRWEQEQAADQQADAKLKKQLMICRNCMPAARDDANAMAVDGSTFR